MKECVETECDETDEDPAWPEPLRLDRDGGPVTARSLGAAELLFRVPDEGSYHMLSDQLRVGWHPEYDLHLTI